MKAQKDTFKLQTSSAPSTLHEGLDKELMSWINLSVDAHPEKKLEKVLGVFYTLGPYGREPKPIPFAKDTLTKTTALLKNSISFNGEDVLPDRLCWIVASWFLSYLNVSRHSQCPIFAKSILVYTYNQAVVQALKRLYWVLRDSDFPTQTTMAGGINHYDNTAHLLSDDGWREFQLISLSHLGNEMFVSCASAVARQNYSLFYQRYPVILLADPTQPKLEKVQLETFYL